MSRRILSAFLALVLVVTGFSLAAKADVTGTFDLDIAMVPESNQTEAVAFTIDLQSNLQVNVSLSGISFGIDVGFGNTGIEFSILSLDTNLGALQIEDEFWFATPFACDDFPAGWSGPLGAVNPPGGQCSGENVFPIGVINDGGPNEITSSAIGFVQKRVEMTLNIAGIELTNLTLFADVDFPDIHGAADHSHDHFGRDGFFSPTTPGPTFYVTNDFNTTINDSTPTFGFGDIITISGQTISGITVTGSTGICADLDQTRIKKRSSTGEVNSACVGQIGGVEIEGGAKTALFFEVETLDMEGIEVGGVVLDISLVFKPLAPITATITASFDIAGLADATVTFTTTNLTELTLSSIVITLVSGNLTVELQDTDADLTFDVVDATLSFTLNPNQNPASLDLAIQTLADGGLNAASITLAISRNDLDLTTTTSFTQVAVGELGWASTSFSIDFGIGDLNFGFSSSYTPSGMGTTTINFGFDF